MHDGQKPLPLHEKERIACFAQHCLPTYLYGFRDEVLLGRVGAKSDQTGPVGAKLAVGQVVEVSGCQEGTVGAPP
jgi:hypothetical protein